MELRFREVPSGVTAERGMTVLAERAAAFLAFGPADAVSLIAHVCQLPGAPRRVAEHMADALLGEYARFARDGGGQWRLREVRDLEGLGASPIHSPGAPIARPGRALSGLAYAVVDVETTGSRPDRGDRITEIAAVVVRGGEVIDRFETLVNPERSIPPWISALTNISWPMVKDAPPFREVCDRVLALLAGRVFVAHNANFDWGFVAAEVERASGRTLDGDRLCTVRLARRLLPQLPRRSLDHLAAHYGVDITARHRAMGDAHATAHCLLRLLADARGRGVHHWHELNDLLDQAPAARRRRPPPAMPHPVTRDTTA